MTTLDHATTLTQAPAAAALRPALAVRVVNAVAAQLRAWKNRRAVYRLGELSDWELADIGLTRSDLHIAWSSPVGTDPTLELGLIATARALKEQSERRQA